MNKTDEEKARARRFRHLFKKSKLTQEGLARMLGLTPQTIYNYRNNKSPIPLPVLYFLEGWVADRGGK
jgi:transcriptional regulator with XRE-family HTH domain